MEKTGPCFSKSFIFFLLLAFDFTLPCATTTQYEANGNLLQYRPGDIIIAGLMRVHKRGNELCSDIQEDGVQAVETMNMIIDQINNDSTILKGIKLGSIMVDTCDVDSHALRRVVIDILPLIWNVTVGSSRLSSSGPKVPPVLFAGVVGSASSAVSIQVANLLQVFKIPQVSYWSTSPDLSNKVRYKYFFRVVPSDSNQANAMIALVKQQDWNYISVVYEDDFYGVRGFTEIKEIARKQNVCIATSQPVPRNPTRQDFDKIIKNLIKHKAKAVIVFTKLNDASDLMLAAQNASGKASEFIWMGSDGWTRQIPIGNKGLLDSTVDGAVGFTPRTDHLANLDEYITNITLAQNTGNFRNPWFAEYISSKNKCNLDGSSKFKRNCRSDESVDPTSFKHLTKMESVADSVLAFVNALQKYHIDKCGGAPGICESMKSLVGTNGLATGIYSFLKNISFKGINGRAVQFDKNQDGPAVYNILNFNAAKIVSSKQTLEKWVQAGIFQNNTIDWTQKLVEKVYSAESVCSKPCGPGKAKVVGTESCCWICQTCQSDEYVSYNGSSCLKCTLGSKPNKEKTGCKPLPITEVTYQTDYGIACICVGSFGLLLTLIVTVIYIVYRDTAIVKASGKELCFFVLFGILLTFLNFLAITGSPTEISCIASRILLSLGPTCMYAGLLTKTVRVVIIFQSKSVLSPRVRAFVRPLPQILWTSSLVMIQVIVLVVWFVMKNPKVDIIYPTPDIAFRACTQLVDLPLLIGLIYPFLLIIICTILATINRNVPTGFNETQYIGFSMYTTCVIWLAFLPIFITNPSDLAQRIMTTSICLSLSATTVLVCLFGPRCFTILFHPEENTQQSVMSRVDKGGTPTSGVPTSTNLARTSELNSNVNNNNNNNNTEYRSKPHKGSIWMNGRKYLAKQGRMSNGLRRYHNEAFDSSDAELRECVTKRHEIPDGCVSDHTEG